MKATELRIGNLIQLYRKPNDKKISIHAVSGIENTPDIGWMVEIKDCFYINIDKGIEPIPLTEDWFYKHGEIDENGESYFNFYGSENLRFYLVDGFIQLTQSFSAPMFNFYHITEVHQFQNLYFAMTGRELIIEL